MPQCFPRRRSRIGSSTVYSGRSNPRTEIVSTCCFVPAADVGDLLTGYDERELVVSGASKNGEKLVVLLHRSSCFSTTYEQQHRCGIASMTVATGRQFPHFLTFVIRFIELFRRVATMNA